MTIVPHPMPPPRPPGMRLPPPVVPTWILSVLNGLSRIVSPSNDAAGLVAPLTIKQGFVKAKSDIQFSGG
jgi:hypothetical protein